MKRRIIAAVWVAGAIVPLLMATVLLVGCCVLPFHGVVHKVIPMCELAAGVARGHHDHNATPPAQKKDEPVKRIVTQLPRTFRLASIVTSAATMTPAATTSYRSFISLGATRCDRDVGLHEFVVTFRI